MTTALAFPDQGCATNAPEADFFINSEGECSRNDVLISGSLDMHEVCQRYGFNWSEVCHLMPEDNSDLAKRWRKANEDAWEDHYQTTFTKREYDFSKKVFEFMRLANFGRFRVYGEMKDGKENIVVVTEFQAFVDQTDFWDRLKERAVQLHARIWIMREEPHMNQFKRRDQMEWQYGPDHGRLERQVELSWQIQDKSPVAFKRFLGRIRKLTNELFTEQGVGVC